jgi:L-rhamnose isomerase
LLEKERGHMKETDIERAYQMAQDLYLSYGVDTDRAIQRMNHVVLSLLCQQSCDPTGLDELVLFAQQDMEFILKMIPGRHRVNLAFSIINSQEKSDGTGVISSELLENWIKWASPGKVGIDISTSVSTQSASGLISTLSHRDPSVRKYWIEQIKSCRSSAAEIGKKIRYPVMHNLWIADASQKLPVDRLTMRMNLKESLDEIYGISHPSKQVKDSLAINIRLSGIGHNPVGSYDFFLAYAIKNKLIVSIETNHADSYSGQGDKVSSLLPFTEGIKLNFSCLSTCPGDHEGTLNDQITQTAQEVVRSGALNLIHLGVSPSDPEISKIEALVVGARAVQKAFLYALLEPTDELRQLEAEKRYFERLALLEEIKSLPFGAVWDYYCIMLGTPPRKQYMQRVMNYDKEVQLKR